MTLERYYDGRWHTLTDAQEAVVEPHLELEQRLIWVDGEQVNVGGDAVKTAQNRRLRRPIDDTYIFYVVSASVMRRL